MARRGGLGKGLDALFLNNRSDKNEAVELRIAELEPNKSQPRKFFDETELASLADSIKEHGVLQPILVRPLAAGGYQIVAGERRWRASRMAGLQTVPVVIRQMNNQEAMEIALIENLQRENLGAIEEARGYRELMKTYHLSQEEVAKRVGKSRSTISNALRLLSLPEQIISYLEMGRLSAGQARALLSFATEPEMIDAANFAIRQGASVRELEKKASAARKKKYPKSDPTRPFSKEHFYQEMEVSMRKELHRTVHIHLSGEDKGTLSIDFYNQQELVDMAYRLADFKKHR